MTARSSYYANWWDGPPDAPWLSPEDAAQLAREGPNGDGTHNVPPEAVRYGTPLKALLEEFRCVGEFLEAAAMAGHSGAIAEGVQMTLRASHAFSVACADTVEAGEHVERGYVWDDAVAFREIALTLELLIADLDRRGAQLYRFQAATGGDTDTASVDLRRARAGDERAVHARRRADAIRAELDDLRRDGRTDLRRVRDREALDFDALGEDGARIHSDEARDRER